MRTSLVFVIALSLGGSIAVASSANAQQVPWRITKTEWSAADEKGFGEFVAEIARSGCTTTVSCMRSAANLYHESDPTSFDFHADCAKWVYMLRAYYASKHGLPFSYVSRITGTGDDLRFTTTSNHARARRDIIDTGNGIATVPVLKALHDEVWTATYRMHPADETPVEQDFYSPKIQPGSIRPGTAIYDINGHVGLVYEIAADGRILYMDAYPDEHVSRQLLRVAVRTEFCRAWRWVQEFPASETGGRNPDGRRKLHRRYNGAGIKRGDSRLLAGAISGQCRRDANADGPGAQFAYNGVPLGLFEYARASMSRGGFAFNPVYELKATLISVCRDARDARPGAMARTQSTLAKLRDDIEADVALWEKRDLRVVYDGRSLKETLGQIYNEGVQACAMSLADAGGAVFTSLDQIASHAPATDVRGLITSMSDAAPFSGMRPVGY